MMLPSPPLLLNSCVILFPFNERHNQLQIGVTSFIKPPVLPNNNNTTLHFIIGHYLYEAAAAPPLICLFF